MPRGIGLIAVSTVVALLTAFPVARLLAAQEPAAPPVPQPVKGTAVRGCLMGSRLTQVEPSNPGAAYPESLGVSSIRVIKKQLKALNGHRVELIGTIEGVDDISGILVVDSDKGKLYLGGGDARLGEDQRRTMPPTIYAHTVRDIAPTCTPSAK